MQERSHPVRTWVIYLLAAVLLVFGFVSFARRMASTEPVVGVEWAQTASGVVALSVDPGSPGWTAGIKPGDLLLRIDERPVDSAIVANEYPWTVEPGHTTQIELRRGRTELRLSLAPGLRHMLPGSPLYGYLALVGLAFLASGVFIALRWPTIRGGLVYSLLGTSLFALLVFSPTGKADALDWTISWIDVAAGAFAPALLLHLAMVLSRRIWKRRKWLGLWLAYSPAVLLLASSLWLVGARGAYRFADPVLILELRDRAQMLFLGLALLLAALLFHRSYLRSASGLHRSQMRWLIWGLTLGSAPFVVMYLIPWAFEASVPRWVELSIFPLLLVPAAFTAALARYRLHDLDLLLRRGLTEVTAVFFFLAIYAASQYVLRREEAGLLPLSNSAARYVGLLVSAVAYPKLRSVVRTWVDRAVYRQRYSYRATLLDWARELNAETDLRSLLERVRQRVRDTLDVPTAQVLLRRDATEFIGLESAETVRLRAVQVARLETQPYLSRQDHEFSGVDWAHYVFGMKVKGRLRAVLVVAEREGDDHSLSTEDRALLSTLSAQAATAIEAARLLQEVREGAEQVARLQTQQARILESSGVGLLLLDGAGRIVAWNRALEEIYGMSRADAIGCAVRDVFPLHLVRAMEREVGAAARGEEARLYRYGLVNRAGQRRVLNISVNTAESDGSASRVVSFDDITERVKLEEQVLQQERLAALGLLAAGVAHEVNTPLTGISSYTQLLLEDLAPDDPRREILEKIDSQTHRASNIANSLLNLARPERSEFTTLSVNETVNEVLRLFEPQVRGTGVRVEINLADDLPPIRGHKGKLQQVLLNLLLNAKDAIDDQGCITIATHNGRGRNVIEVIDDGIGIAQEDLSRIFDPFFTTKTRGKGTGLGLSISYAIVREHDGEIEVDSEPGAFTRFRVVLPGISEAQAVGR